MKMTKADIDRTANEIMDWLIKNGLEVDVYIYYNNKRMHVDYTHENKRIIEEDMNPLDYFEYAAENHIISMSFEGDLYDVLNGYVEAKLCDKFDEMLKSKGLWYELGEAWNLTMYPCDDNSEIEYTNYKEDKEDKYPERCRLYISDNDIPEPIKSIMIIWRELCKKEGDGGSCVIGAGIEFEYSGILS